MNVHNDLDVALPPGNDRDDSVLVPTVNDALRCMTPCRSALRRQ